MLGVILICLVVGLGSGYLGADYALKDFRNTHTTLTVFEKDAEFLREDLRTRLNDKQNGEQNKWLHILKQTKLKLETFLKID